MKKVFRLKMKTGTLLLAMLFAGIALCNVQQANAQDFTNASEYMGYMSEEYEKITNDTWDYISAVNHGKSARKVDKNRKAMLSTVESAKKKISSMPPFNGSTSYRDSVVQFLDVNYKVLNHDYAEIVNMEEVAEQSYDLMEAYLLAQEKANKKLGDASEMVQKEQKKFAEENNINLVDGKSKTGEKLAEAGEVMEYYNKLYLIFFKPYKQEAYLLNAMGQNDVGAIQQNRNSMVKYAKEGMKKVQDIQNYKNDPGLKEATRRILKFYIDEGENKIPLMVDYNIKKENFDKIKKAFDDKKESKRTQADVEQFNKAVNELNEAANKSNEANAKLNAEREERIKDWNKSTSTFLDKHTAK